MSAIGSIRRGRRKVSLKGFAGARGAAGKGFKLSAAEPRRSRKARRKGRS